MAKHALSDPDALLADGKTLLLDAMPVTAEATAGLLRTPPRARHAAQTDALRRWFAWIRTHVGNGQLVRHCVSEDELREAWAKSKNG